VILGGIHLPASPYYWIPVGVATVAFAVIDLEALRRREMSRWHGFAVAIYVGTWGVVLGLVRSRSGLWFVPAAVRIGLAAVFGGGQLLAEAVREEQRIAHRERRKPRPGPPRISEDERRAAEEYDAHWQREDRERNHEHALHEWEEREHRKHSKGSDR
jgi:hypothetical protein